MLEIKDLSVQYGKQAPTIEHFNLSMDILCFPIQRMNGEI